MSTNTLHFSDIPNAQRCVCRVWRYEISHSLLQIRITEPISGKDYWLSFANVQYYEGPMIWTSAHFRQELNDDALRLLREKSGQWLELPTDIPEEALTGRFKLYVVHTPEVVVRIVAESRTISKTSGWVGEVAVPRSNLPSIQPND